MTITASEALQRTIEHREIFHDEMLQLMRMIMGGEIIDVDAELGFEAQKPADTPPETENSTEICEKPANSGEIWVPEQE